jgi:mono/diheme cytochrome c family protein
VVRGAAFGVLLVLATSACQETTGPVREISGQQLYEQYCARCHGVTGRPTQGQTQARDLSDRRVVDTISDEAFKGVVRNGRPPGMPAFREQFTDGALNVLIAYVRSLSGSEGKHTRPSEGS